MLFAGGNRTLNPAARGERLRRAVPDGDREYVVDLPGDRLVGLDQDLSEGWLRPIVVPIRVCDAVHEEAGVGFFCGVSGISTFWPAPGLAVPPAAPRAAEVSAGWASKAREPASTCARARVVDPALSSSFSSNRSRAGKNFTDRALMHGPSPLRLQGIREAMMVCPSNGWPISGWPGGGPLPTGGR